MSHASTLTITEMLNQVVSELKFIRNLLAFSLGLDAANLSSDILANAVNPIDRVIEALGSFDKGDSTVLEQLDIISKLLKRSLPASVPVLTR